MPDSDEMPDQPPPKALAASKPPFAAQVKRKRPIKNEPKSAPKAPAAPKPKAKLTTVQKAAAGPAKSIDAVPPPAKKEWVERTDPRWVEATSPRSFAWVCTDHHLLYGGRPGVVAFSPNEAEARVSVDKHLVERKLKPSKDHPYTLKRLAAGEVFRFH